MQRHHAPAGMTTKEFYFNHVSGLSNSGLGKVADWLEGRMGKSLPEKAFRFGSMVDAMLTQPDELVEDASDAELLKAIKLSNSFKEHPLASTILEHGEPQVILTKEIEIDYEGILKTVAAKCMLDLCLLKMRIGCDIKTTAAGNMKTFLASIARFNYDRQAYWYMEVGELDRFVFIGLSKVKSMPPFIWIIKRGDPMWLSGKEKASALAYYADLK
jgi:hypothetical protein